MTVSKREVVLPANAKYVPVGSIFLKNDECNMEPELWSLPELAKWRAFTHESGSAHEVNGKRDTLPSDVQQRLLRAKKLDKVSKLFESGWAKLDFKVDGGNRAIVRVYLLPDDVHRGILPRNNASLFTERQNLLGLLEYSKELWNGDTFLSDTEIRQKALPTKTVEVEQRTLLELFNTIPSPSPTPEIVMDLIPQAAMLDLLNSKVDGLRSELYPYQRRSAALMVQREVQPGQILDPRLQEHQDQGGGRWYFDRVTGTLLSEPRHYDGVRGGILAEEMGSGKTIICLALILATRDIPGNIPELYGNAHPPTRPKVASLLDMAASCASRHAAPWRSYFYPRGSENFEFKACVDAMNRNPGYYFVPPPEPRRVGRHPSYQQVLKAPEKIYLSRATLIIVPNNLVAQWKEEVRKHTEGLKVLILAKKDAQLPHHKTLLDYDIIMFSQTRFEMLVSWDLSMGSLSRLHFKRCIIDEGHKLGNSRLGKRSNLLLGLERLKFDSRWVVTGTPSHGLFGVDKSRSNDSAADNDPQNGADNNQQDVNQLSDQMERKDLERIGSIATLFLKVRPWANSISESADSPADWDTYLMLPRHKKRSFGRWDSLTATLNSLILRHQLHEVGDLLPPVKERVVRLNGSYQDKLSMNLFSMMIIFNSVQSQRTDMDYFFHPKQRRSLLQIVHNLKQSSFFGGSFFSAEEIRKSVLTAEEFLDKRPVPISPDDEQLLQDAIRLGHVAIVDSIRNLSNKLHEMPICVENMPGAAGQAWALIDETVSDSVTCTSASLLLALQKLVYNTAGEPEKFNALLNGGFVQEGLLEKEKLVKEQTADTKEPKDKQSQTLAGNTKLGGDSAHRLRSHGVNGIEPMAKVNTDAFSGRLESTRIIATVSAKLSYLLDQLVKHQDEEKIIVFYENENIAWYLASMLDVLQIQHLIYAKSLTAERRAQYVTTFHQNPLFRVLLMDLSQAAFGLDMREASRIYFINPVLNPQVEAQAIGRARRVSQKKPVTVETLVLKGSIDEVLLERKEHMTQAEHRQAKSILDIRPIYNWIKNAIIDPLSSSDANTISQMAPLEATHPVFGKGFGTVSHPDEGLVPESPTGKRSGDLWAITQPKSLSNGTKRRHSGDNSNGTAGVEIDAKQAPSEPADLVERPARKVRFA